MFGIQFDFTNHHGYYNANIMMFLFFYHQTNMKSQTVVSLIFLVLRIVIPLHSV